MTCNHPHCDCSSGSVERNGRAYCSEACATGTSVSAGSGGGCGCGHAGCGATLRLAPSPDVRAGADSRPGDRPGHGITGDGLVGDTTQRILEQPGRQGAPLMASPAASTGGSDEDQAGAAMKPGAARPRGEDESLGADPLSSRGGDASKPRGGDPAKPRGGEPPKQRGFEAPGAGQADRASVHRGQGASRTGREGIEAPDARDRGI